MTLENISKAPETQLQGLQSSWSLKTYIDGTTKGNGKAAAKSIFRYWCLPVFFPDYQIMCWQRKMSKTVHGACLTLPSAYLRTTCSKWKEKKNNREPFHFVISLSHCLYIIAEESEWSIETYDQLMMRWYELPVIVHDLVVCGNLVGDTA